ncbi:MAG: hypoxanthine phosphoribosyltransferase [Acidimicrobiales bacterium]
MAAVDRGDPPAAELAGPGAAAPGRAGGRRPLTRASSSDGVSPAGLLPRCTFPPAGTDVTVAVSGGADSLALLILAVSAGCRAVAVHVDHGLRPGSEKEADVVRAAAERLGAGFRAERAVVAPGPNLEARAREARYGVLPAGVLTGHTADDQAETILLNLLRGAGLDGLGGMAPEGHPLLGLRRWETRALCQDTGLTWVEDPSNTDPVHRRNRIRAELLPLVDVIADRDVVPLLSRQAEVLRSEAALLDALAAELDATDPNALTAAPVALARRAVRRWLSAEQTHPPDLATVDRVLAVARLQARAADVGGGRRVTRSAGRLSLEPGASTVAPMGDGHPGLPEVGPVVVTEDQLRSRVTELGKEITADYAGRAPLLVGVLKGAFMFMSDLARAIDLPVEFDFMAVSSYGSATKTSGVVRIVKDLDLDLTGRDVILVEDIVDSGLTLSYLRRNLKARSPATLEVCALLVREGLQQRDPGLRYVGFRIPPDFVIGYGLDVAERYRNLPYVCVYSGEVDENPPRL